MKCNSCGIDVPAAFKQAIIKNICPGCEGPIMTDAMQELLDSLKDALEKMPNDPQGLAGWLISNYQMVKIGTGEPVTTFYGPKTGNHPNTREENLKIAPSKLDYFMEKAGINPGKNKDLIKKIHGQDLDGADYGELEQINRDDMDISEELQDSEYTKQALSVMANKLISKEDMRRVKKEETMDDGISGLPKILQADRFKRLEAQKSLQLGGSVGKITRS